MTILPDGKRTSVLRTPAPTLRPRQGADGCRSLPAAGSGTTASAATTKCGMALNLCVIVLVTIFSGVAATLMESRKTVNYGFGPRRLCFQNPKVQHTDLVADLVDSHQQPRHGRLAERRRPPLERPHGQRQGEQPQRQHPQAVPRGRETLFLVRVS